MAFRTCTHIKADGIRCGSPALRGQNFCYFHYHSPDHRPTRQARMVEIPFPEDAASIQVALHNVMLAIIDRRIDDRRASQLLWSLQIAAAQCKQLPFNSYSRMSQAVTELPDYEVERMKKEEEARRCGEELLAHGKTAAASGAPKAAKAAPAKPAKSKADDATAAGEIEADLQRATSGDWQAAERLFRRTGVLK